MTVYGFYGGQQIGIYINTFITDTWNYLYLYSLLIEFEKYPIFTGIFFTDNKT